ncbi:MAG: thiamine-phosphate kinase [Alphaproteobacteria bacterium]|nr:thiamine-phosphate kinase [Alphaproteobacteria bacterium]
MAERRLGEFERIARFFAPLAGSGALELRDDVALIDGPDGAQWVLTVDAIVAGIDYLPDDPPGLVARKLMRVNLSDLAAKGARPFGYLLTTVLPAQCGEDWLAEFSAGLAADQKAFGIVLLGGDSSGTSGPATLSMTAIGSVVAGTAILRRGAQPGDELWVSGTIGDSALGLRVLRGEAAALSEVERRFLVDRYRLPRPRLELGARLVGIASAMLDVSDGLVADLGHLCDASGVAATIEAERIPLSSAARQVLSAHPDLLTLVLAGGDDYELVFAAPPGKAKALAKLSREVAVPVTRIGAVVPGSGGVRVRDGAGREIALASGGFRHF